MAKGTRLFGQGKDTKYAFLGLRADPRQRKKAKRHRIEQKADRGNLRKMQQLALLEEAEARKRGAGGVDEAALRQAQQMGQEQVGAQIQGAMANVAPVGTVGSQTGMSAAQMTGMGEAAAEGAAQASGQAFDTQARIAAQANEAYKARLMRAGEFQAQQAAQAASMIIGGVGAAGAGMSGVGALV